nr:hypothetical protein [Martelella limonii]
MGSEQLSPMQKPPMGLFGRKEGRCPAQAFSGCLPMAGAMEFWMITGLSARTWALIWATTFGSIVWRPSGSRVHVGQADVGIVAFANGTGDFRRLLRQRRNGVLAFEIGRRRKSDDYIVGHV